MKTKKSYSNKVKDLIVESKKPSLKILLEENEEENASEEDFSFSDEFLDSKDNTDDPDPANPDPANPDPANPDPANPDPANPDPANPDPANTKEPEDEESSVTPESLKDLLNSYVKDFTEKISNVTRDIKSAFSPDSQAYKSFVHEGYYNNSLKDFLFEDSGDVTEEDLESLKDQIEMISDLSDLLDDKFNRPSSLVTWEDIPYIVDKSIELINTHDPVKYSHEEAIKYLKVKTNEKQTDEIVDEFNRLFNEKCKEEDIESPELVTGVDSINPVNYNSAVKGQST